MSRADRDWLGAYHSDQGNARRLAPPLMGALIE
ncbi:hypothetical protein EDC27_1007 [Desulfosoma caldarium]|uniref:Uncharacterized protein n=1 Tax=Desulfosoma caldarium TaxID=610254 RepID=A0A3N1VLC0_9BACT|nr:hypothetical protein EDC27_1007 [Desulfosoma caldarium]